MDSHTHQMDITYHHDSLEQADNTLNAILDIIVEGTWDWNANTGLVERSPGWYRMLGFETGIFNKDVFTWESIIHPDDYNRVMHHFELYIQDEIDHYQIEYRCKKADGSYIWIADRGKIIERNIDGSVARMIGAHNNIDEQKKAQTELIKQNQLLRAGNKTLEDIISCKASELELKNELLKSKIREMEDLSEVDPLTKIANRKKFETVIEKEIKRARRYKHPLSLIILDIDYFKNINDNYGHKTGDNVLTKLSWLLKSHIRNIDFIARWGGEEFAIILPEQNREDAAIVAENMRRLISSSDLGNNLYITCSFGVAQYREEDNINRLFIQADLALYSAKELGRNRVQTAL